MKDNKENKHQKNWLGGSKNTLVRSILVVPPTIAGAYLGWEHGSEFANAAANSEVFYHQIAAAVPLLTKAFGAYIEGRILSRTGGFISGIAERISQNFEYSTENTNELNEMFEPTRPYRYYGTLGKAEYEKFVESFILNARRSGEFKAFHIDSVESNLSRENLEGMLEKEYLVRERRFDVEVISPTYKALKAMYGTDKHHEVVKGPFCYSQGKKIASEE